MLLKDIAVTSRQSVRQWLPMLLVPVVFAAVLRLIFFQGLSGADDLEYVRFATLWDRPPANHWESRVLYNGTLRLAIRAFGRNELAYAVPGLACTFVLIACSMWCAYRLSGRHAAGIAGLIVAFSPLDTTFSTVPLAGSLSAALACLGTVPLLEKARPLHRALGCLALGLSILAHVTAIFYVGAMTVGFMVTATTGQERVRSLMYGAASVLTFFLCELLLFTLLTGDPFHEFKIVSRIRYADPEFPVFSARWFLWPVENWIVSKHFGVTISAAAVLATVIWRKLESPLKALAIGITVFWLWFGWGTLSPIAYEPFWREMRYAHLLVAPLAILLGCLLAQRGRAGTFLAGGVVITSFFLLTVSGSWGQNVEISRDFLTYVRDHPSTLFLTDQFTRRQLLVLNGSAELPNVTSWDSGFVSDRPIAMLINPINPISISPPAHVTRGSVLHSTSIAYRPLAAALPRAFVLRERWFIRRPAGQIVEVVTAPAKRLQSRFFGEHAVLTAER